MAPSYGDQHLLEITTRDRLSKLKKRAARIILKSDFDTPLAVSGTWLDASGEYI